MEIKDSEKFKFAKGIRIEFLGDEALIIDLNEETIFSANDSSTQILKIISEENTYENIKKSLVAKYGIKIQEKKEEIETFLHQLLAEGIVVKDGNGKRS